jgi:glycosyltransferase involved in cell wall biosynthesis
MNKKGWLINDTLTCIPNTRTFWHDLLDWFPNLEDKCNGLTPFHILPEIIEEHFQSLQPPEYIIRNASYFRRLNIKTKVVSLLQDILVYKDELIDVCNHSDIVVFNSSFTQSIYNNIIHSKKVLIPLGTNFNMFVPDRSYEQELDILPNSILFIGSTTDHPKGFDILLKIIDNSNYNFCLVMKDEYRSNNPRVKVFNRVDHQKLVKIINSCKILVCTSRIETLHLAGVEAAACNLPLVVSNVGIYYNLDNGSWGRNVGTFNHSDFINEIDFVFRNYNRFDPRNQFLKLGLDTESCKQKWINLIGNL